MTKPVRKYLVDAEVRALMVRDAKPADKLLIQLGLNLGCRVSEIASIKLRWINGQTIKIWDEKKDVHRYCVIDKETASLLLDYLINHYVIPRGYHRNIQRLFYISHKTINRRIKDAFEMVGVSTDVPWRWHTLRHTYIRRTLDMMKDAGIQYVSEQTGDAPESILKFYAIPSIDDRLKAVDEFSVTKRK